VLHLGAQRSLLQRNLRQISNQASKAHCVMLGSSVAAAAFDPKAFAAAWPGTNPPASVNAAIGAATPVERLLMARLVIRQATNSPVAILGFFDFELTMEPESHPSPPPPRRTSSPWWTFIGSMTLGFRMDSALAAEYYTGGSHWEYILFRIYRYIPMCLERASTWGRVERLRRVVGSLGLPNGITGQLGRADDFKILEAESVEAFRAACARRLEARGDFIEPIIDRLCRELRAADLQLIILEMPASADHQSRFYSQPEWAAHRARLAAAVAERYQARYWVGSNWVPDIPGMWFDGVHVLPAGADQFSQRLANELVTAMPELGRPVTRR